MGEIGSEDGPQELDGLAVEAAVDHVVDDDADPSEVRETLGIVAQDSVVRRSAVDDAVGNASMVVTTAETRVELAGDKLNSAQNAAEPVADIERVSHRLHRFESQLTHLKEHANELGNAIQEILAMKNDGNLYEIATRIKQVTRDATDVQRVADDMQLELDSFIEWLTDADTREEELTADVNALADSVNELEEIVEAIERDGSDFEAKPANRWAAAMVRHRVASLMIRDLEAEVDSLRTWAEREDTRPPSNISPQLAEIRSTHETVGERLTASAEPAWTAQFDDQLTALDDALEEMEPPVSWAEVENIAHEHKPTVE